MLENAWQVLALWALAGYLMGTIPFGLILTRIAGMGDIRDIGSGNIGATNVLRTGNKLLAAATLILDGGKGALAVGFAVWFSDNAVAPLVAGAAAFLGHIFPIWLKFKGGKGVATFLGTVLALSLPVGAATAATWIVISVVFRYSSLSALTAATLAPVYAYAMKGTTALFAVLAVMTIIIYVRHHDNIRRLITGQETRIGGDKKTS